MFVVFLFLAILFFFPSPKLWEADGRLPWTWSCWRFLTYKMELFSAHCDWELFKGSCWVSFYNIVRSSRYYVKYPELTYVMKWPYINKTGFFFHFIWLMLRIWLISNLLPNMERKCEKSNKRQAGTNDLGHVCLEKNTSTLIDYQNDYFSVYLLFGFSVYSCCSAFVI